LHYALIVIDFRVILMMRRSALELQAFLHMRSISFTILFCVKMRFNLSFFFFKLSRIKSLNSNKSQLLKLPVIFMFVLNTKKLISKEMYEQKSYVIVENYLFSIKN
jgi:hypothetical protein